MQDEKVRLGAGGWRVGGTVNTDPPDMEGKSSLLPTQLEIT